MYPFWSFLIALVLAQVLKPVIALVRGKGFQPKLVFSSGGNPSSHTAAVTSLTLAVGLRENFDSTLFAVTLAFGLIVAYDAANVRYYAGKNISLTKQMLDDLTSLHIIEKDEPIYFESIKEILGHKWSEVFFGAIVGLLTALVIYWIAIRR